MIRISVRSDYQRLGHRLDNFERRQLPFAAARALTATAKAAQEAVEKALHEAFDRPTPFTQKAIATKSATKANLSAEVFAKPIQVKYLGLQERGGTRRPKKRALVNPAGVKLNQYGNIPAKTLARLKKRKDVFIGTVNGVGGLWQRPARGKRRDGTYETKGNTQGKANGSRTGLTLLMRFAGPMPVKPHPFFMPAIAEVAKRDFPRRLRDALAEALRTAR